MDFTANDPRLIVTSGGTFCLVDAGGRLVGTITRPVARVPVGAGQEKVYLARPSGRTGPVAALHAAGARRAPAGLTFPGARSPA